MWTLGALAHVGSCVGRQFGKRELEGRHSHEPAIHDFERAVDCHAVIDVRSRSTPDFESGETWLISQ